MMDSIKSRIHRRVNPAQIEARRLAYKSNLPELRFKKSISQALMNGRNNISAKNSTKIITKTFTIEDVKQGYFRLLSDNIISEIIPHVFIIRRTELRFELTSQDGSQSLRPSWWKCLFQWSQPSYWCILPKPELLL